MARIIDNLYTKHDVSKFVYYKGRKEAPDGLHYNMKGRVVKIRDEDFPEWYLHVYIFHTYGWLNAKGVKYLVYSPNYHVNHLYKDDFLYISYDKPIVVDEEYYKEHGEIIPRPEDNPKRQLWYKGYDYNLYGGDIVRFAKAVKQYSDVEGIDEILDRMEDKVEWFKENFPEEAKWHFTR